MADAGILDSHQNYKVYSLTNTNNGKLYFGITKRPIHVRVTQHQGEARRGSRLLISRAIAKHGWSAFQVEVVASNLSQQEACDLEISLIDQHGTCGCAGYNVSAGGQHGHHLRPETKLKKSKAAKAAWLKSKKWQEAIHNPDRLQKIGEASKRAHRKPEYRQGFMKRHADMIAKSIAEDVRARAVETFVKNGHAVSVRIRNGQKFKTAADAARWVQKNTEYKKAGIPNILNCAKGKRSVAYGLVWDICKNP